MQIGEIIQYRLFQKKKVSVLCRMKINLFKTIFTLKKNKLFCHLFFLNFHKTNLCHHTKFISIQCTNLMLVIPSNAFSKVYHSLIVYTCTLKVLVLQLHNIAYKISICLSSQFNPDTLYYVNNAHIVNNSRKLHNS